jgi:uncharacterized lipoprotein YmbA
MDHRRVRGRLAMLLLGVVLLALAGCVTSPPVRFYILTALSEKPVSAPGSPALSNLAIGVGPVTLPEYLDRPQIVTRAAETRLAVAEFDQWAAPLEDDFARVLAENLTVQVPTDRVAISPWSRSTSIDYQVLVEATRFDAAANGEVVLLARWRLLDADGKELAMKRTRLTAAAGTHNYAATVTAMSRVLEELGEEIAMALRGMARQKAARQR